MNSTPQRHQLLNLFILLCIGKYLDHVYLSWRAIVTLIVFSIAIEHLFLYAKNKTVDYFSFSSSSTVIGVILMMVSLQLWVYLLIITLGLLQKHFLCYEGRHFFNPSNFALLMGLLLFYDNAHIVQGQLGDNLWLMGIVLVLAAKILWRVQRWIIPLVFSLTYFLFENYFVVMQDPVLIMEEIYYRFFSVSFLVFIVFMLTDPRTTPQSPRYQIIFATCISLGAVSLDVLHGFRVQHIFLSLAFCSPWVVLFWLWRKHYNHYHLFMISSVVLLCLVSTIAYIECKPPYYFSMDG